MFMVLDFITEVQVEEYSLNSKLPVALPFDVGSKNMIISFFALYVDVLFLKINLQVTVSFYAGTK